MSIRAFFFTKNSNTRIKRDSEFTYVVRAVKNFLDKSTKMPVTNVK